MNVELDPATRRLRPTILFGGSPARFVRLSSAGVAAMDEIETGQADSAAAIDLAERLIDAGMAHRQPETVDGNATQTVSIVIPVYDRDVADLVAGLRRSAPGVREIIIVDDASPSSARKRLTDLAAATPGVQLIRHDTNRGPAAARNTGSAASKTARVLFVDSDCEVPHRPGWLEVLLGHIGGDGPPVAAVAPRIVASANETNRTSPVARRYLASFGPLDMGPQRGLVGPDRRVRYVPTAALLVDLGAVGDALAATAELFDARLRFGEDVDFVWRLEEHGSRVVYEPSVRVGHREPVTLSGLARRRFDYGTSAAELDRRHPGTVVPLAISPWSALAVIGGVVGSIPTVLLSFAAEAARLDERLRDASLPSDQLDRAVGTGLVQSALGAGRYLNQFWWPAVLAVLVSRRVPAGVRLRLLGLCIARSVIEVWRRDGSIPEKAALVGMRTLDEAAYGAGVWRGALSRRNARVIMPRLARWKPR